MSTCYTQTITVLKKRETGRNRKERIRSFFCICRRSLHGERAERLWSRRCAVWLWEFVLVSIFLQCLDCFQVICYCYFYVVVLTVWKVCFVAQVTKIWMFFILFLSFWFYSCLWFIFDFWDFVQPILTFGLLPDVKRRKKYMCLKEKLVERFIFDGKGCRRFRCVPEKGVIK